MEDIIKTIISTISEITHRAIEEISPATRLAEDLSLKSITRIELAALLEDSLNITITNFDILKTRTVQDIITLVQKKQEQAAKKQG